MLKAILLLFSFGSWWASKTSIEQVLWIVALTATVLFVIQTFMSFSGGDGEHAFGDADDAMSGDHGIDFQFITFKNLLAFFIMFGWVGLGVYSSTASPVVTVLIALVAGLVAMFIMAWIMKQMNKLQYSGTANMQRAVGQTANVYLHIPAIRKGKGKVHVTIQGSLHELEAMTDDDTDINTGAMVTVKELLADNLLIVTKLS